MSQPSDLAQGDKPAYTKSMMDYLGDREPFSVFEGTPSALRAAATAVPEEKLRVLEALGKWSVLNLVQHLAHVELVLGSRYRIVLAEEGSPLVAMDPDRIGLILSSLSTIHCQLSTALWHTMPNYPQSTRFPRILFGAGLTRMGG